MKDMLEKKISLKNIVIVLVVVGILVGIWELWGYADCRRVVTTPCKVDHINCNVTFDIDGEYYVWEYNPHEQQFSNDTKCKVSLLTYEDSDPTNDELVNVKILDTIKEKN